MRKIAFVTCLATTFLTTGCAHKGTNPADPYEPFNRSVYKFNQAIDSALIKPTAKVYKAILPSFVRKGIDNFFNNLDMVPSVANDVLQAEGKWAIKDTWRFVINSSIGVGGLFDVASKLGLPAHYNDVGLTFAKWGDKNSPYLMIPLIGPSTFRDGAGMVFQFSLLSPYLYLDDEALAWGLAGVRYVDLRSLMLENEGIMDEALDKYAFLRDAYLQHRNYQLTNGAVAESSDTTNTVNTGKIPDSTPPSDYVDE